MLVLELRRTRTVAEVGGLLGVTGARVSQIHKDALAKVAAAGGELPAPGAAPPLAGGADLDLTDPAVPPERVEDLPTRKELIVRGRASLVDLGHNPDDWVDEETQEELRQATPRKTIETLCWGWGRFIHYTGKTGRQHQEPTSATMRQYVKDHWHMCYPDGRKRGRRGQPYAPRTVELAVYTVAMVCNRMGWANPVRNPLVHDQIRAYWHKFEEHGFKTDESDPISPAQSVALARSGDLGTINGLRNATMFRLQFDTGCRATELTKVRMGDVEWLDADRALITFIASHTKTKKKRVVAVQAERSVDWDVDPVRLLGLLYDANRAAGYTSPTDPLFHDVVPGNRRKDFEESGVYGGRLRPGQISYDAYEMAFNRSVVKSGIDRNPRTGERTRHITTHSNRSGFLTAFAEAGEPLEKAAARTGHNPGSRSLYIYFRSDRKWGGDNPGVLIRRVKAREEAAEQELVAAGGRGRG